MKLQLIGHNYQYAAEQIMMVLFPGEKPVYGAIEAEDDNCAAVELFTGASYTMAVTRLRRNGRSAVGVSRVGRKKLEADEFSHDRMCQRIVKLSFFKAATAITGQQPPWGALTGIRPARLVTQMLDAGMTERQAMAEMTGEFFVSPRRAKLCLSTARFSRAAEKDLRREDISLYVGIPFCPTRCAYCSFVSASVEKTFSMIEPYLDALCEEIALMGESVRKLGLNINIQPASTSTDIPIMESRLGSRAKYCHAWRTLTDLGVNLNASSDVPVETPNVFCGIYAIVTRKSLEHPELAPWNPHEKVTVMEALRFYTINSAYAAFEEHIKGSVTEGKLADLVILDRDPCAVDPEELPEVQVDATILGGKIVYLRNEKTLPSPV